ncbi:MAG: hypothetical protein IKE51_01105 [Solobacterium sp.]|nr:hypothetical protein [Solobacterium sp.]
MKERTYYLIEHRNLVGKKEVDERYYLFHDGKWIRDNHSIILGYLMGYDETEDSFYRIGNTEIMDQIHVIPETEANKIMAKQVIEYLRNKWEEDFKEDYQKWQKNLGWPAKYVETRCVLYGEQVIFYPDDIGVSGDCWGEGFMELKQKEIEKDLREIGATNIVSYGFLD